MVMMDMCLNVRLMKVVREPRVVIVQCADAVGNV